MTRQLRRRWYGALESWPAAFCAWNQRFPERSIVTAETDLMIEGYPSAGNSFAREALQRSRPGLRVASHLHSVAHVRRALRLGVPVLILLRPPAESIVSLILRFPQHGFDIGDELQRYRGFYSAVLRRVDEVALSSFTDTTNSLGDVIRCMNYRFGLDLPIFCQDDDDEIKGVFDVLDGWSHAIFGSAAGLSGPRPSPSRKQAAQLAIRELDDPAYRSGLARCQELHATAAEIARSRMDAWRVATTP